MKEILRSVSVKGQVTLPVEVRRVLGIAPRGKVAFAIDGGEVHVKGARSPVDETFQAVPALKKKLTWDELRRIAQDDAAEEAVGEGR